MENSFSTLSSDEIQALYFNSTKQSQLPTCKTEKSIASAQLTATAAYIAREAKKHLAQFQTKEENFNPTELDLINLIKSVESISGEELNETERNNVADVLNSSLTNYNILTPLINNSDVQDIIIRSHNDISIQSNRQNIQTDLSFSDAESYKSFVENLLKQVGKSCTQATPVVDAAIGENLRLCVSHESFSPPGHGPMLTIRIARENNSSLEQLYENQLAPRALLNYLATVVSEGNNTILIAGEVGTGKTTLIKALSMKIPENEAILIIEDTYEIKLVRRFVRTLLTREANTEGAGRIPPAMAIRTGMRMAMNRLILGEMRDAEAAEAFIDVCSSGHSGISTIHARSAKDAILRLELLLARAQGNITIDTIRKQIANAVSVVAYLGVNKSTGKRHIQEIVEINNFADGTIQYSPIFKYQETKGDCPHWKREAGISKFRDSLEKLKIILPEKGTVFSL
ncbi:MAG: CpaF family protein [Proteobacteria bacterium]|nr:CpaF family protein [Pseudomonadota bacterium]